MAKAPQLGKTGTVTLDDAVFGAPFNEHVVHEVSRAELNARRQGTAATKTRGMVRGGGAKPWKQKGTGRARQGSIRSPQWAGGGTVFGPQPRHYTFKVNRKVRRIALRSVLSLHVGRGSLAVLDTADFETPSTKKAFADLGKWGEPTPTIVVLGDGEEAVGRSFRNLKRVKVLSADRVGIVDIISAASFVATQSALDRRAVLAGDVKKEAVKETA